MADRTLGSMVMEETGSGPPVVMIHGLGGTSNSFQTLMEALEGCRVLRPDLPGAGRSAIRPGYVGLKGLAMAVREGLQATGIRRAHFVGHSMGSLICQYLAAEEPGLVGAMTLFGAIFEPAAATRQMLKERAQAVRTHGMAGVADIVSTGSVGPGSRAINPVTEAFVRESLLRQNPGDYAIHCEMLSAATAANHSAISCPTLLVAGEQDPVAPVDMARRLQEAIEGARLEVIGGISHWIMIEDPAQSAKLLSDHIKQTS